MAEGAAQKATNTANLLPSSTYSWVDDAFPGVVHTFTTSAVVEGSPPSPTSTVAGSGGSGKGVSYPDIVGSAIAPFRGTLTAAVSAAGRLSLSYRGRGIGRLKAGRYTVTVVDASSAHGLVLRKPNHAPITVSGSAFMGRRSASVRLTAGRWLFGVDPGKAAYSVAVG
jgi:hypothetical protein